MPKGPVPISTTTHNWSKPGPAPPGHQLLGPDPTFAARWAQKQEEERRKAGQKGGRRTARKYRRNRRKTRRS